MSPIRTAVSLAVPAALALSLAAAPTPARPSAVCPHPGTIDGMSVLIDCGPDKATIKFGGATLALKNGLCQKTSENFTLGFGAVLTGPATKRAPDTFQLIAGGSGKKAASHDGTYSASLQFTRAGRSYAGDALKLTLTHKRAAGTLAGTLTSTTSNKKVAISGSFTC